MKKILVLLFLTISVNVIAQIHNPVTWKTNIVKISDTECELIAKATIEDGWHLYSQLVPENGPVPTKFIFIGNGNYLKKGNTKEDEGHTVDDPIFNMEITYFGDVAEFKQRIKLKTKENFIVKAIVEFMVCNDSQCLPPNEVDLEFNVIQ